MAKIAISLSGGGFRAATFHLGALSYLNHLKTQDGTPLLDHVSAMSTISGGTLTGLWMILGKCRGWSNDETLKCLYKILFHKDIIGKASREFLSEESQNHSLIREMVRIYDEEIFQGATMGELMGSINKISIDDFSANATEFTNANEFRFHVGKSTKTAKGGNSQGIIGNYHYRVPYHIASQIRLAEIFAASSCLPGGFEALFFPRDFQLSKNPDNADYIKSVKPLPLMDGGVVDNQGIEPICLLRKRRDIDLFIISDAGNGEEVGYTYKESRILDHLTIHRINIFLNFLVLSMAQFLFWVPNRFLFGFFLGITILLLIFRLIIALGSRSIVKKYSKHVPFSFNWKKLLHIPISKYINLFMSRATSMWTLTDEVFMKHIRSLNYATIYNDEKWQNRRIMNALYKLCSNQEWGKHLKPEERPSMEPSENIRDISDKAASMSTTLWWSEEDKKLGRPQAIIAAGQYNLCWTLLEFIYRLRRNKDNLSPEIKVVTDLQPVLEKDWQRFKENPLWMTDELFSSN